MTQNTRPDLSQGSNKLIAEFMGEKYSLGLMNQPLINHKLLGYTPIRYHESWDWLIPVIEKISKLNLPDLDGSSEDWQPFPRTFGMVSDDTGNFMFRFNRHALYEAPVLIDAAYSAVVDFLKGYCQLRKEGE